jgi:hypothetical protein
MSNAALYRQLLGLVVSRPGLLLLLPSLAWRFRRRDWYRRWPFLPLPAKKYMEWRMHTAFGSGDARPSAAQLEKYVRWSHSMRPR